MFMNAKLKSEVQEYEISDHKAISARTEVILANERIN